MAKLDDMRKGNVLFDEHHRMERFCVMVVILVIILATMLGLAYKKSVDDAKAVLDSSALYTTSNKWSLTQENIEFLNMYRDENFTKAFVLLKIDSMDNLSLDANDYTLMMLDGNSSTHIECNPKASIYVFGNTGYMGLYFVDKAGFNAAFYRIIIRNDKMVGTHTNEDAAEDYGSKAFEVNNMTQFYANLRGSDGIVADFLSQDQPNVEDIYKEIIANTSYDNAMVNINNQLLSMNVQMGYIKENAQRLDALGIQVPELPDYVRGDKMSLEAEDAASNPTEFDASMIDQMSTIITGISGINDDDDLVSDVTGADSGAALYFVTDTVHAGGVQFDHHGLKITDGKVKEYLNGLDYRTWRNGKTAESNNYGSAYYDYARFGSADAVWNYKDGTAFVYDANESSYDAQEKQILDIIKAYDNAMTEYINLKTEYQKNLLVKLLEIEAEADSTSAIISVRTGDDTLIRS